VKEQNAVLITGTASYLQQLKSFLKEVDLPVPQVSIEVVIVEYTRKNESSLGVSTQTEAPNSSLYNQPAGLIGLDLPILLDKVVNEGPFKNTGITVLPQDFTLRLSSSLSREKGKILAMPKVTTLNGNKASLRVSTSQYFPVTTLNQEGLPSTDFRTISDGITIDLTPWVTKHGDVNLEIQPSIKTAKPPTTSNNVERPGDVSDRAITSNVRLMDGQTLILGGLIDTKENVTRSFVPILGSIPLLGYLFSNKSKTFVTTELVLFVTPRVLGQNNQNVDIKKELEKIEDRSGNIKSKDIIKESSKKTK
jgi:type IV pilus assembly protein PilQ